MKKYIYLRKGRLVTFTRRKFIGTAGSMGAAFFVTNTLGARLQNGRMLEKNGGSMENSQSSVIEWRCEVPIRYEYDIAILGGGIAGVTAAVAAAKSGARVILVERFGVVGGNATVGGVGAFCGETRGQGEVFDAIVEGLQAFDAIAPYRPYEEKESRVFDCELLAVVLQELLIKHKVKILLHTEFVAARSDEGFVQDCIVSGPSGPECIRARLFIDCTGEAHLVARCGFQTVKGRPGDGLQLPMSMMFFVRHIDESEFRSQIPSGWFESIEKKDDLPMTSIWPNGPRSNAIKIKVPLYDATDTESLTSAEIRGRRRALEVLDFFQRKEKKLWRYCHCSPRIGIREGRRIVGNYTLTVEDLRAGRAFDDAIARGVFYLDGHKPDDDKRTYILPQDQLKVPPYHIPFRCLIPQGSKNLLAAGRCLSADQLALSSARVMTTCAMMGQAAGIAAAMLVERSCDLDKLDGNDVRRETEARGAQLQL